MPDKELRIHTDAGDVRGVVSHPENCRPGVTPGLILGHGAANNLDHPLLAGLAERISGGNAASVLRFNFPYAEKGLSSRDPFETLVSSYRRAHDELADDPVCAPGPVFLGGKSLGARVALELASRHHEAEGLITPGLVFLGYPLHPPGKKEKAQVDTLRRVKVPVLFVEGTRDPFCDLDLLRSTFAEITAPVSLHVVEGGDHSLEVPVSRNVPLETVYDDVAARVIRFLKDLS